MLASSIVLVVTLAAGLGYTWFRRVEEARGVRVYADTRAQLDIFAEELWRAAVLGGIPLSWRHRAQALAHEVGHEGVHMAVTLLRAIEAPLSRLSYRMRVSAPKTGAAPVSEFLKTITPDRTGGDFQQKSV
jgi:hypothetical protein